MSSPSLKPIAERALTMGLVLLRAGLRYAGTRLKHSASDSTAAGDQRVDKPGEHA
jgi:hypothetical protein